MAPQPLTLMAVHAHPDDEAISTGGILARYSDEGVRTVLVTCTDGACGDGPGGVKPGEAGHDPAEVVAMRAAELETSCAILGVSHLELLGYADSGMMGWPDNDAPGSFWTTPVEAASARLGELMRIYRPQVVVTYDPNGFYGHPDHIQAHRITMAAVAQTGIPAKVYWPTIPRSGMAEFARVLREHGVELPDFDPGESGEPGDVGKPGDVGEPGDVGKPGGVGEPAEAEAEADGGPGGRIMGSADEEIAAWVDVAAYVDRKYDALAAHASQSDSSFFLRLDRQVFAELMGREPFLRAYDTTAAPLPESDLFAGIRPNGA